VAGDDRATAVILTLADMLVPAAKTEIVFMPALDGRLLTVEQAGKRRTSAAGWCTRSASPANCGPSRSTASSIFP
jgi:hypothetical protein